MAEEETNLLNGLVAEYLTKVAPATATDFQCLLNSPSPVNSFKLEDAVQHFSKTSPLKGRQGSGEEKVLCRVSIYIQGLEFCSMLILINPNAGNFVRLLFVLSWLLMKDSFQV